MFYAAINSISVISRRQFTLSMSFLGFISTRLGLYSVLPKDTPTKKKKKKKPRGSSAVSKSLPGNKLSLLPGEKAIEDGHINVTGKNKI